MKNIIAISTLVLLLFSNSCGKSDMQLSKDGVNNYTKVSATDNSEIKDYTILTYYNSTIHNVVFKEFSSRYEGTFVSYIPVFSCFKLIYPKTEESFVGLYPGFNFIYQSDPGLPNNQPFISVID